jgi:hypothetical protein
MKSRLQRDHRLRWIIRRGLAHSVFFQKLNENSLGLFGRSNPYHRAIDFHEPLNLRVNAEIPRNFLLLAHGTLSWCAQLLHGSDATKPDKNLSRCVSWTQSHIVSHDKTSLSWFFRGFPRFYLGRSVLDNATVTPRGNKRKKLMPNSR